MDQGEKGQQLLTKYLDNSATESERLIVEQWYAQKALESVSEPTDQNYLDKKAKIWNTIAEKHSLKAKSYRIFYRRLSAVAAVLIAVSVGLYFFYYKPVSKRVQIQSALILPGKNSATLTLSNGDVITLDDKKEGLEIAGNKIHYYDGDSLTTDSKGLLAASEFLTASTPRGGTYQFLLPDGSKVYLNAASAIKFPSAFVGKGERIVELLGGEAYFEIKKDPAHPFIVKSANQDVRVLGTHFNINAYSDEPGTLTTLLEGSVAINKNIILKPGEQSALQNGKVKITTVDPLAAVAWTKGEFFFNEASFESTMNMIARWYDVEIIYDYKPANLHLAGRLSRNRSINEVLKLLQITEEVKFKIEGRRIRVIK